MRGIYISTIVLRMMIGFALFPQGSRSCWDSRLPIHRTREFFTSSCTPFMRPVGSINLSGHCSSRPAVLLITQRHATLGTALIAPILVTILVFCWSTGVVPTAIVVTLMSVGLLALILWDIQRWKALLGMATPAPPPAHPGVNMRLWSRCGWFILLLYFGNTAITGQVYRPMGAEWSNPSFIVLLIIAVLPVVTFALDSPPAKD